MMLKKLKAKQPEVLMADVKETVLEINLNYLEHNYTYLKSKISDSTKFLAVVKAFGYGSDAVTIAKYLETFNVDYFAVAYVSEGVALRDQGITSPILVLHPQPINFEMLIDRCLEPSLYSPKILKQFIAVAEAKNQNDYPVHIKFNTGLNRLGFWENDIDYLKEHLSKTTAIKVTSIFSHLAASEDVKEREFTQEQIKNFNQISENWQSKIGTNPFMHMCNTSGVLNYPEAHFDMVRCGIGLYGFGNSAEENKHLKPIASLKSVISQIHNIEPNESVGYNRAFKSTHYMTTATIPIGHADGVGRQYGNEIGFVIIKGKKAPIIGNVCMDMMMVNISGIDCKEGDEVIIFDASNTAETLSERVKSISYELITGISQRVKRKIIR